MCYTYVLRSDRDKRFYTGAARDLWARVKEHADDAFRRERFLKTGKGKRFLRNRLASFLSRSDTNKLERD